MTLLIGPTEDLETCHALRRTVFIEEQGVNEADEMDDLDPGAIHLLARQDGVPVGTARVLIDGAVGKIGRICVLASHRGSGLGKALVEYGLAVLREKTGVTEARLGAQIHALDFYRKLGFEAEGPIYDDAGIPHRMMRRSL